MATVNLERRAEIGRLKRQRTSAAIIDVALTVIKERGMDEPTIDDFIVAAGVSRGTFYNHFATKDELMRAVSSYVADAIDARITPLFLGVKNPAQRISIAIREFIRISRERPEWGGVLARTLPSGSGWSEDMRRGVLKDIRSGVRMGQFTVPSVQSAAVIGIGALAMAIRTAALEKTPAHFAESIAMMTLQAMGMSLEDAGRIAKAPLPEA